MNKVIVFKNLNGGCGVIHPTSNLFDPYSKDRQDLRLLNVDFCDFDSETGEKTNLDAIDDILNWIANKDVPSGLSYRITDISNIPNDRVFRNAWTDENPTETIDIDILKAKEIKKEEIRRDRKPLLENLDVEAIKALSTGGSLVEIETKKTALRDATKNLPDNLEDLKQFNLLTLI